MYDTTWWRVTVQLWEGLMSLLFGDWAPLTWLAFGAAAYAQWRRRRGRRPAVTALSKGAVPSRPQLVSAGIGGGFGGSGGGSGSSGSSTAWQRWWSSKSRKQRRSPDGSTRDLDV
jgi:hypothetical protein